MDTDVAISGTWSGGTSSIVTTTQIMLSLLPVATDSSGEYTVTYNIRSSDNSPHIIEYNGTDSYNLAIACKLMCRIHYNFSITIPALLHTEAYIKLITKLTLVCSQGKGNYNN